MMMMMMMMSAFYLHLVSASKAPAAAMVRCRVAPPSEIVNAV